MEIRLILHDIRSLHNVGSIFRTADAAGVEKVYLCGITPAPLDRFGDVRPRFGKVALGAEKYVQWEKAALTRRVIDKLKSEGCRIFAVEQSKSSIPYDKVRGVGLNAGTRIALIFGNETKGLPQSVLAQADKILEIPMRGAVVREARHPRRRGRGKESLNVSVAVGIVTFGLLPASTKSKKGSRA